MTPRTTLGGVLLAQADELGSVEALAGKTGVSRQALAGVIEGSLPSLKTFWAIVGYLGVPAEEVLVMLDTPDTGEPWRPDHAAGGKARQDALCSECRSRLGSEAAATRWAAERAEAERQQVTIWEAGA